MTRLRKATAWQANDECGASEVRLPARLGPQAPSLSILWGSSDSLEGCRPSQPRWLTSDSSVIRHSSFVIAFTRRAFSTLQEDSASVREFLRAKHF